MLLVYHKHDGFKTGSRHIKKKISPLPFGFPQRWACLVENWEPSTKFLRSLWRIFKIAAVEALDLRRGLWQVKQKPRITDMGDPRLFLR